VFGAKSVGKIKIFSWHYHAVLVLMMYFRVFTVRYSCLWYIFVSFPCGTGIYDIFSFHYRAVLVLIMYFCLISMRFSYLWRIFVSLPCGFRTYLWRIFVSFPCGIRTYDVFSSHYHAVFVRMIYFRVITMRYSYVWCIFVSL
jgi:hypothetical protein